MINIKYPESLADILKVSGKELESEIKKSAIVNLYERGRISSGTAAKVLGMSRLDFLELLSEYKVSVFSGFNSDDLSEELNNA